MYSAGVGITPRGWIDGHDPIRLSSMNLYPPLEALVKKRVTAEPGTESPSHLAAVESVLFERLHSIVAHLAVCRYDDGSPRQPGTLLIRTVGGHWQVTAKEPDVGAQLVLVAGTLDDALAGLSLALESDSTPWQPDPWAKAGARKSKK